MSSPYDYEPPEPPYVEPPPPETPPGGDQAPPGGGGAPGDPTVSNVSRTLLSVNEAGHTATYRLQGSWANNTGGLPLYRGFRVYHSSTLVFNQRWGGGTQTSGNVYSNTPYANDQILVADDNTWGWQTQIYTDYYGIYGAPILWFRSAAVTPVASTPTITDKTSTTATLNCYFYPNTFHSTATVTLQYKKSTEPDSAYANAGTSATTGGYPSAPGYLISRGITGLLPSTQYSVRLVMTRTTVNATSLTSAVATFTTLAGTPAVTTDAATNLGSTTVTLNGTLDINSGVGVTVYFKWGPSGNEEANTTTPVSKSADGSFSANLTGLNGSTTYYFKAYAAFTSPSGSPVSGTQLSFTTDVAAQTPEEYAALEDHMLIFEYDRIRKTATTVYFSVASPQAANSNNLVTTAPGSLFAANDVKVSVGGAAAADATNLATIGQVTNAPQIYTLALEAAELDAEDVWVRITDAAGGPSFRDTLIHIRTKIQTGQIVVNASQAPADSHAVELTPAEDEGYGLKVNASAVGPGVSATLAGMVMHAGNLTAYNSGTSVDLDSAASAQDDIYVGGIILIFHASGVQARTITDYNGTSKEATLATALNMAVVGSEAYVILPGVDVWNQGSAAELTGFPGATTTFQNIMQLLYQRFAFKIDQNATTQTWYESTGAGGSAIMSRSVSDDGSTQVIGQLT